MAARQATSHVPEAFTVHTSIFWDMVSPQVMASVCTDISPPTDTQWPETAMDFMQEAGWRKDDAADLSILHVNILLTE